MESLISSLAVLVLGFALTFIASIIFGLTKQGKLFSFLGVQKDVRRVNVYLSSLYVRAYTSFGFDGLQRSYEGVCLPSEEFSIIGPLSRLLEIDAFENIPPIIRRPLQQKSAVFRPLIVDINASPMESTGQIDFSSHSIITIGSQGYNRVTNYCLTQNLSQLEISNNGTAITIVEGRDRGVIINPASNRHDIAILERLVDQSTNTTIIVGAGLSVIGTMGSIYYLIDHWKQLQSDYTGRPFALILQFGPVGQYPIVEILRGGVVIRRLPEN